MNLSTNSKRISIRSLKPSKGLVAFSITVLFTASPVLAVAIPGKTAPSFEGVDAEGRIQKLSDYKGKWIVLEWFNKGCPSTITHYRSKNMQFLQKTYTEKGVVWLSVISSAKGKQGYVEPTEAILDAKERGAVPSAILLDGEGVIGKAYGAKTTPHMFVVDPDQKIAYAGAIDDNDSPYEKVIFFSKNYVAQALDEGMNGKPITTASTRPYGCGIKYKK